MSRILYRPFLIEAGSCSTQDNIMLTNTTKEVQPHPEAELNQTVQCVSVPTETTTMGNVSLFGNSRSTKSTLTINIAEVAQQIRDGKYQEEVEAIRELYASTVEAHEQPASHEAIAAAKKAVGGMKTALPAITFCGEFSTRNSKGLTKHAGQICIDIDNIEERLDEVKETLSKDLSVALLFLSPTGTGIKVVYRIPPDPEQHKAAFKTIYKSLKDNLDIEADEKASDLSRLCFVSYDPTAHYNPDAREIKVLEYPNTTTLAPAVTSNASSALLQLRQRIAEDAFEDIQWEDDISGHIRCPGIAQHTNPDKDKDCRVFIDGTPTVTCFHESCRVEVETATARLRKAILDGETPEIHYEVQSKNYWVMDNHDKWITMNETGIRDFLIDAGYSNGKSTNGGLSQVREKMLSIRRNDNVAMATPLAGHKKGIIRCGGDSILVTKSAELIEPVEGEWELIRGILENLFQRGQHSEQIEVIYGWLKLSYEAARTGQFRPGQALAIAGEPGCGKNLFQDRIITPLLGGRSAKPYRYMTGGSEFNADLFAAEHLVIQDETAGKDFRSRRAFGAKIKDLVVNQTQSLHAKGKDALVLKPIWRVSISLNDEPEDLEVLPPFEEGIGDKLILVRAIKHPWPVPNESREEQRQFNERIQKELPALCHYLMNYKIPEQLECSRYGVLSFHNSALSGELGVLNPEMEMLELLDSILFDNVVSPTTSEVSVWTGKVTELKSTIITSDCSKEMYDPFLRNQRCMGILLGKLAKSHPERVKTKRTSKERVWEISNPNHPFLVYKSQR